MNTEWQKYISIDPEIHHGEPCIKGTRIPVSTIVGYATSGMNVEEILAEYPQLSREAIQVALTYQADEGWGKLLEIRGKLGKGSKNKKSTVEILSEMRR